MDKDRIAGSIKQATGPVRQTVGKLIGDHKAESEGRDGAGRGQGSERHRRAQGYWPRPG